MKQEDLTEEQKLLLALYEYKINMISGTGDQCEAIEKAIKKGKEIHKELNKKKKIDLSVLKDSQIDCVFSEYSRGCLISKLTKITNGKYEDSDGEVWNLCKPRMDEWLYNKGYDYCPIPEGFEYSAIYQNGAVVNDWRAGENDQGNKWGFRYEIDDIIAFKITGISEGWEL